MTRRLGEGTRGPEVQESTRNLTPLFLLAAFSSAFASFQIQPLMSKLILPWFGGGPWIWAICLLFFQSVLLLAYLYSHLLSTLLPLRLQVRIHVILLGLGSLVLLAHEWTWPLAILPGGSWHPHGQDPTLAILGLLSASVGLPYFLLVTTSPLIQTWFVTAREGSPYRLYAVSNAGSLFGLLSYPFLVEPLLDTTGQSQLWEGFFLAAAAACALAGVAAARRHQAPEAKAPEAAPGPRPGPSYWIRWFTYAAIPSAMLVSTTTLMTETVAAAPLLWVAPLTLYLLTLIATFHSDRWHRPALIHPLFAFFAFAASVVLSPWGALIDAPRSLLILAGALFFASWACHAELARAKPEAAHLSLYYVVVSLGGAVGSALISIGAPLLLPDFWEFHLSLFACAAVLLLALLHDPSSWLRRHKPWLTLAPILAMLLAHGRLGLYWAAPATTRVETVQVAAVVLVLCAMAFLIYRDRDRAAVSRPFSLAQLLVALLLLPFGVSLVDDAVLAHHGVLVRARSFYGVLTVEEIGGERPEERALVLKSGITTHGVQLRDPKRRHEPVSYYHRDTGISRAVAGLKARFPDRPLRIGVIGLGAGSLAAYARSGDFIHYYELDPNVITFARKYFSFLRDTKGVVVVTEGDARLSLQEELATGAAQRFDLLVIDAFSGDTVPLHLISAEAFALYRAHLRDATSLIAMNISNRFLDLEPVVANVSAHLGLRSLVAHNAEQGGGRHSVTWAVMSQDAVSLAPVEGPSTRAPHADPDLRLWTDEYSDILGVFRWRR